MTTPHDSEPTEHGDDVAAKGEKKRPETLADFMELDTFIGAVNSSEDPHAGTYRVSASKHGEEYADILKEQYRRQPAEYVKSVNDVGDILRGWGETKIAERLEFLASDDAAHDDIPVALPAALGFLEFYCQIEADAILNLTSAQGWLCTEWDYADGRSVALWFTDRDDAMLTVFDSSGNLVELVGQPGTVSRQIATESLVQAGFFEWKISHPTDTSFLHPIT